MHTNCADRLVRMGCVVVLILVCGCSPNTPEVGGPTSGEITDIITVSVTQALTHQPISSVTIKADFIDTDNRDHAGQFVTRWTGIGITDLTGVWTRSVTYRGDGNEAANKVNLKITHPTYHEVRDVATLRNHEVSYGAQLMPR